MIDLDVSQVITDEIPVSEMGARLYKKVLEIAKGAPCKAEIIGDHSWLTPPCGTI